MTNNEAIEMLEKLNKFCISTDCEKCAFSYENEFSPDNIGCRLDSIILKDYIVEKAKRRMKEINEKIQEKIDFEKEYNKYLTHQK